MADMFKNLNEALNTTYTVAQSEDDLLKSITLGNSKIDKEIKNALVEDDMLNVKTNDPKMIAVQDSINSIEQKKELLSDHINNAQIKDSLFLENEIKALILSSKSVLNTLEKDIKIGSQPRMYEVYATLLNSIIGQYKELRQLNEAVAKLLIESKKVNIDEKAENRKSIMTSKEALDMVMNARLHSNMNAISTQFEIMD